MKKDTAKAIPTEAKVQEISKKTAANYIGKASRDAYFKGRDQGQVDISQNARTQKRKDKQLNEYAHLPENLQSKGTLQCRNSMKRGCPGFCRQLHISRIS